MGNLLRVCFVLLLFFQINENLIAQRDTCCEFIDESIRPEKIIIPSNDYGSLLDDIPEKERYIYKLIIGSHQTAISDSVLNKVTVPILEKSILTHLTLIIKSKEIFYSNFYKVKSLKKIKFLHLKCDSLDMLPKEISDIKTLERLDITSKWKELRIAEKIPSNIKHLELYLWNASLLPEVIYDSPSLDTLLIYGLKFHYLSSSVKNLKSLRQLSIFTSESLEIPQEIRDLSKLNTLMLEARDITFDLKIVCPSVTMFEYGRGGIKNVEQFPNLEALLIANEKEDFIPDLKKLQKLKYIKINAPEITTLPDYIFTDLKSLEEVDITDAGSALIQQGSALRAKYPNVRIRYDKYADRHFPRPPKFF